MAIMVGEMEGGATFTLTSVMVEGESFTTTVEGEAEGFGYVHGTHKFVPTLPDRSGGTITANFDLVTNEGDFVLGHTMGIYSRSNNIINVKTLDLMPDGTQALVTGTMDLVKREFSWDLRFITD